MHTDSNVIQRLFDLSFVQAHLRDNQESFLSD